MTAIEIAQIAWDCGCQSMRRIAKSNLVKALALLQATLMLGYLVHAKVRMQEPVLDAAVTMLADFWSIRHFFGAIFACGFISYAVNVIRAVAAKRRAIAGRRS